MILSRFSLSKDVTAIELHPYEVAYLAQGKLVCIQSVICYLMSNRLINTQRKNGMEVVSIKEDFQSDLQDFRKDVKSKEFYRSSNENIFALEEEVGLSVNGKNREQIESALWSGKINNFLDKIGEKLVKQSLQFSKNRILLNKTILFSASVFPVALILITRVVELYSLGRSIMFESIVTLVSVSVAALAIQLSTPITKKAKDFIAEGKHEFVGLYKTLKDNQTQISSEDFVRAFSLSGALIFLDIKDDSLFKKFFFPELEELVNVLEGED